MKFVAVFLLAAAAGCGAGEQPVGKTQGVFSHGSVSRALRSQANTYIRRARQVFRSDLPGLKWNLRGDVRKSMAYYKNKEGQLSNVQRGIVRDKLGFSGRIRDTSKEQEAPRLAMEIHKQAAELAIMTSDLDKAIQIMQRITRLSEKVDHVQLRVSGSYLFEEMKGEISLAPSNVERIAKNLFARHAALGEGS